jgi:DNA repair protein RadA/Sms
MLAIVSSLRNRALPHDLLAFGEVGLSGEVRPVQNGQERLQEAVKHGFTRALVPLGNIPKTPIVGLEVMGVANVEAALTALSELS